MHGRPECCNTRDSLHLASMAQPHAYRDSKATAMEGAEAASA